MPPKSCGKNAPGLSVIEIGLYRPSPIGGSNLIPKLARILTIENITATNSGDGGSIVGLPESPVLGLTLKNVHVSGKTGMVITYSKLTAEDLVIKADTGDALQIASTVTVTKK